VVASENGDSVLEADLVAHQQGYCLHRVIAPVHVISHEQIIRVRRPPSYSKELHEIVELAMDVPANCDRAPHWLHIALLRQDLFRFITEGFDFMFGDRFVVDELLDLAIQGPNFIKGEKIAHFLAE